MKVTAFELQESGQASPVGELDFLPKTGDFVFFRVGQHLHRYEVNAIIHDVINGRRAGVRARLIRVAETPPKAPEAPEAGSEPPSSPAQDFFGGLGG
jgi:hypothetical protein